MDIAIVDVPFNGIVESMKIASMADAYEVNVAPHNFYSPLATTISAHFCAAVPNLRIMEIDHDVVPWYDDLVTVPPHDRERPPEAAGRARLGHRDRRGGGPRAPAPLLSRARAVNLCKSTPKERYEENRLPTHFRPV